MKQPSIQLTDKNILLMGAITLFGFSIVAWLVITLFASNAQFYELVYRGNPLFTQLLHGCIFGVGSFFIINVFIQSNMLGKLTTPIYQLAKQMNWVQIVFISFAAGFGEELLFRVSIQYFFGIWPTAILFVMIHGYLSLSDWRVFLYGVVMTVLSAGFGYLYFNHGIAASMTAHFMIDLLILYLLKTSDFDVLDEKEG